MSDAPVQTLQGALEQNVILLAPSIGWWKGQYQLPRHTTDVTVGDRTVAKRDVTTPRAKLIGDTYPLDRQGRPWKKRFQRLDSRLERIKDTFSVKFPIAGVRVVPKSRGVELMHALFGDTIGTLLARINRYRDNGQNFRADELQIRVDAARRTWGENASPSTPVFDPDRKEQSIAYELAEMAHEFCHDYEDILRQISSQSDVWDQVKSKVPRDPKVMRAKFYLDVVPIELAGGGATHELTRADLSDHQEIVRETCTRQVEMAVEEMIRGPREQLAEALASLQELIARNGRVTERSFAPVRRAIEKIRMFGSPRIAPTA